MQTLKRKAKQTLASFLILGSAFLSGCSELYYELATIDIHQPDRIHYNTNNFRWRKTEGDRTAEKWSKISRLISGEKFQSCYDGSKRAEVWGGALDFDWRLDEISKDSYFNLRFGQIERNDLKNIKTKFPFPVVGSVELEGKQTSLEIGLTQEFPVDLSLEKEVNSEIYFFATARIGYAEQKMEGRGEALIAGFPLRISEDFGTNTVYGGLEIGARIPLWESSREKTSLTISGMTNYHQTAAFFGIVVELP